MSREETNPISVRLPADLKRKLEEVAKREDRAVSHQLIHILRAFLAPDEVPGSPRAGKGAEKE